MKFSWNSTTFTYYLWLLFCYKAELSSCDKNHMAHKASTIYSLALCRKSLPTPVPDQGLIPSHKSYVSRVLADLWTKAKTRSDLVCKPSRRDLNIGLWQKASPLNLECFSPSDWWIGDWGSSLQPGRQLPPPGGQRKCVFPRPLPQWKGAIFP